MSADDIAAKIDSLPFAQVIDGMIANGRSYTEVAAFIQGTMGEFRAEDRSVVEEALSIRDARKSIGKSMQQVSKEITAEISQRERVPRRPRLPGEIAKSIYGNTGKSIDTLVELESIYLSLRDRLGWILEHEQETQVPYTKMGLEVKGIVDLMRLYEEIKSDALSQGGNNVSVNVSFGGTHGTSEAVAKVMSNPESRQKIVTLLERLRSSGVLGSGMLADGDTVDAEFTEHDGGDKSE